MHTVQLKKKELEKERRKIPNQWKLGGSYLNWLKLFLIETFYKIILKKKIKCSRCSQLHQNILTKYGTFEYSHICSGKSILLKNLS